jgi:peptide deformylase
MDDIASEGSGITRDAVRLLGDPVLREEARSLGDLRSAASRGYADRLMAALEAFRAEHGFGRAISAPQIGISKRLIALNLGRGPFVIANPAITWRDPGTFTLWDDCMSFPFLLVKLRRHRSISIEYTDLAGDRQTWSELEPSLSELLQHEIDHLEGVLAIDHAIDKRSIISRAVYEAERPWFDKQVDYVIRPTIESP